MAKNVVFLVHGVGRHTENWAYGPEGPIPALEKAAQNYSFFKGKKLSDLVEIVPIYFDDIFDRILKQWQDLAAGLTGAGARHRRPPNREDSLAGCANRPVSCSRPDRRRS